jgi:hypothetical protein
MNREVLAKNHHTIHANEAALRAEELAASPSS